VNRAIFFVAAVLLTVLSAARAELLVYTGSASLVDYETRSKPYLRKCFVATDPAAKRFFTIDYGTIDGLKRLSVRSYTGEYFPLPRTDGSKFDFYSSVTKDDTVGILRESAFFRGLQKPVTVRVQAGTPVIAQRARNLTGKVIYLGVGFGYTFNETLFQASFNTTRTVDVNVRGLTLDQYRAELTALLQAQGFNQ
jgi:hypothetical protein